MIRSLACATLCLSAPVFCAAPSQQQVRAAAQRSIALIQKVGSNWKVPCYSCHHQTMPAVALETARAHGLAVDEKVAQAVAGTSLEFLSSIDAAVEDRRLIDPALSEGYFLWGAQASGIAPSLTLAVYARRLANLQLEDGHWSNFDNRPPHSQSVFTSTSLAAAAVAYYLPEELSRQRAATLAKARLWLNGTKPADTEGSTFRLLGLKWAGAPEADRKAAAQELLARHNSDGGWPQVPGLASDAYSTAQAITALRQAGHVSAGQAEIENGVAWLVKNQRPDGAWLVKTRLRTPAQVSPPYFESGFPGGHDQYLSCAATSWAVMALAEMLPAAASPTVAAPVTSATPRAEQPWMKTALFGSLSELTALLDKGLDVNTATPEGTSLLMMAVDDEAKVRLLLDRGANVNAQSKSGYDALLVASLVKGNRPVLKALIAKGASPKTRANVKFRMTPLMRVAYTGDVGMAEELIAHGADPKQFSMLTGLAAMTPLGVAVALGQYDLVRYLIKSGVSVDETDDDKMTNLSWAALSHRNDSVKLLLELGANPNHVDKFGFTPLRHTGGISGFSSETADLLKPLARK
ncbi:ankyrin repeat domain-containing protein [Paludibaculum fermentans]|uniref:Ankyrin repeat domain-containing protein n=1 Tax=Paludibaculum fermentans TaxID=1473598 RepID=A0A7S7NQL3_PALFE|nr:ankyrin repeat domain-containing protein [Paludibaculum fermentans]QOY87977.1 ankyrin repeat domain-containing protein [Paludibaculum fermentans]